MFDQGPRAMKVERVVEEVEDYDQESRAPSQTVQYFKMLFSATGAVDTGCNIHNSYTHLLAVLSQWPGSVKPVGCAQNLSAPVSYL